jgi:hypothetical protein
MLAFPDTIRCTTKSRTLSISNAAGKNVTEAKKREIVSLQSVEDVGKDVAMWRCGDAW